MAKTKKNKEPKNQEEIIEDVDITEGVLKGIVDSCGVESAQLLGANGSSIKIKGVISTQAATIDAAIGRGGIPRGRLTILHGNEACGKTTLALHLAAETQRLGGVVVYMDKEYKLDPDYAQDIGVDTSKLIISQPEHLEKAFDIWDGIADRAVALRKKGVNAPILIVLDSMNAAITKKQFEGEYDDIQYAPQATVYSRCLPKLMPKIHKEDVGMLWISQVREKVGLAFGDPNQIAGGKAPKFYASLVMNVVRKTTINENGEKTGNQIVVECKKNQIAPPFRKGEAEIIYGVGFNKKGALIQQAVNDGIIVKGGSWYNYGEQSLGQGVKAVSESITDALYSEIMETIEKKHGWQR